MKTRSTGVFVLRAKFDLLGFFKIADCLLQHESLAGRLTLRNSTVMGVNKKCPTNFQHFYSELHRKAFRDLQKFFSLASLLAIPLHILHYIEIQKHKAFHR